jgi:adenylyl- and sulfurtransferase ThiI
MVRFKEIATLKGDELAKLQKSLENNISRNKKKIDEEPEHPETSNRIERVEAYQRELAEVKRLLGLK